MEIIPAIDLREGAVVRLLQGDYDRQTTFDDNPVSVAQGFERDGARRIHVVDLDGAREGHRTQIDQVRSITGGVAIPIELGGGLRSADDVTTALTDGVDRVVLGTAAVNAPGLVREIIERHGEESVAIGIDTRAGMVAVSGWTRDSLVPAEDLLEQMVLLGVRRFIYTDIARDGTLTSPNLDAIDSIVRLARKNGGQVIASGGIADRSHLVQLAQAGVEGAIVGSAIYRGTIDLASAVAEFS